MFKKHRLWILCIVLFHCLQQISSEDDSDKTKREVWSGGSFNLFGGDKKDNNEKSFGPMSPFAQVFSAIDSLGLKVNGNVKTTVEFWPPDMDRDKFYKLREEESAFPLTSWFNFKPLVKETKEPEISYPIVVNDNNKSNDYAERAVKQLYKGDDSTKSLKDYTTKPEVMKNPQNYFKHERYTVKPEIHEIEFDQKYFISTAKPEVIDDVVKHDIKYFKSTIKRPEVVHDIQYDQNYIVSTVKPQVIYENSYDENYAKSTFKPFIASHNYTEYENAVVSPTPLNDFKVDDYSYYSPTEQTVNNDDAKTNYGPVMFPIFGLTEKRINEFITYTTVASTNALIPRVNKKRKLKKKVKTSSVAQFNKEKHITQTPPTAIVVNSSFDVIAETSSEHTPFNGIIDNNSLHYTDIISNLSNLTQLSFSSFNGTGNNHHFIYQADQKSSKNIYSSKAIHSTTPYSFIIKVEPEKAAETQDDVIEDEKNKLYRVVVSDSSTTEIPSLSSSLPIDMKKLDKLESLKNSSRIVVYEKIEQKVNDDMTKLGKIIVESSSPSSSLMSSNNSQDERFFTTTASTVKKLHRSRFGIRNFKPRSQSEAVRNQTSSSRASTTTSSVASTTVKSSIPKRVKSSISTLSTSSSSEKPINDYTMNVKSTARYYTPKSRTRHQNSRAKQITTKSSSLATKSSTVKTKIRRTTKKSSKK